MIATKNDNYCNYHTTVQQYVALRTVYNSSTDVIVVLLQWQL